jgi:hypothetical protein
MGASDRGVGGEALLFFLDLAVRQVSELLPYDAALRVEPRHR